MNMHIKHSAYESLQRSEPWAFAYMCTCMSAYTVLGQQRVVFEEQLGVVWPGPCMRRHTSCMEAG